MFFTYNELQKKGTQMKSVNLFSFKGFIIVGFWNVLPIQSNRFIKAVCTW